MLQCLFWEIVWIGITVLLALHDHYNWHMYTYWQWTYFHFFFVAVALAELIGGWVQAIVALVFAPIALVMATMVAIIIAVVVVSNPRVYIEGTTCDGGELDIGLVRLIDWFLHGLPILAVYSIHASGFQDVVKFHVMMLVRSRHYGWTLGFILFVMTAVVLTMCLYMLVEDPVKRYHPGIPLWALVLIGLAVNLWITVTWLLSLLSNPVRDVGSMPYYSEAQLLDWEARRVHDEPIRPV